MAWSWPRGTWAQVGAAAALSFGGGGAAAVELGQSEFTYVSDLAAEGFEPFAANGGGAVLGMKRNTEMYLCFLLDTPEAQTERQRVLLSALRDDSGDRTLPNVALACVLTQ